MNGLTYVLLTAGVSWLLRLTFVVLISGDRLPARITAALDHTAPAVLAALISVGTVTSIQHDSGAVRLAVLACLLGVAAVARRRPSVALSVGIALAAVLTIDLLLVR
ncbi:MAG TPA: AzlD domain-containing protein [Jatrophihabitans sp.]|nr:AzlD domain-containing protein [Jatrophihabitans sp.]